MSNNINLLSEHFQEIMKQHSESMNRIAEPLLKLQKLPVFEELQKNMQELSRLTEGIALKNQEAFERIVDINSHTGFKALSEQIEFIGREFTAKLSIEMVSPVLKDLQSSFNEVEISEDKFVRALKKLENRDFVEEFESNVSNIEKGHSTAQGITIGVSEVLTFLMFILMLIQTIDNSTDKALKELSDGQDLTNQLLERLIELNSNTEELINKSKNESLKLLIANESVPLRSQPDINSDTLITLFKGQHLDLLKAKDNWYMVQYHDFSVSENGIGWVQKKHIIPEPEIGQVQTKKLGNIATSSKGKKPDLIENKPRKSLIPYVDIQGFEEREFRKYTDGEGCRLCEEGDLLIVWDGSRSGLVGKAPAGAIGSTLAKIEIDGVTNAYGYYFLKSQYQYLNTNPKGSGTPHVDPDLLWDLDIRVPSIDEQNRIVEKIEELFSDLDNGIENLKKAKQQLETYKQSVLKAAFEGKLTKQWREQQDDLPTPEELKAQIEEERNRYREQQLDEWRQEVKEWEEAGEPGEKPRKPMKGRSFDPLDEELEDLPELPKEWDWIRISDTVSRVEYGTSQKSEDTGKVPVLRMGNMQDGKFVWDDLVYSNDPEEIDKYLLEPGDVLFNRTNSPELVGKTALYKGKRKAIFAGYLIRLNQIGTIIDARYLTYYLNSYEAQNYGNKVKTDGVNQSNINGTKLSGYPLPFTCLQEQKKVADMIDSRLSIVDQTEKTIEQELQKAKALRQSILKKAFEGKLVN